MPIKNDLSHLPTGSANDRGEGFMPDPHPRFVQALAQHWETTSDSDKPTALGTRIRHSDAGKCARAIAYTAAGIAKSDPMDLTGVWNTSLGTVIHEQWQEHLEAWAQTQYPDHKVRVEIEPKVGHDDLDASGHLDAVITIVEGGDWVDDGNGRDGHLDHVIVYELKTIGGFGFKAAVGKMRKGTPAEGPKVEHQLQAALNGVARNADEVVIGYLAKECISINAGRELTDLARFAAEWTMPREQYEPMAAAEKARLNGILALLDERGELAARKFPAALLPVGAEIQDPTRGTWQVVRDGQITDTGSFWACGYCSFRTVCATTEPGRIAVTSVTAPTKAVAA